MTNLYNTSLDAAKQDLQPTLFCNTRNFSKYVAFFLLSVFLPAASAAGFDCGKASTRTEKLICSTPELSKLDDDLNAAYKSALTRLDNNAVLKEDQKEWHRANLCDKCVLKDLASEISKRISFLNEIAGSGIESSRWTGSYVRYLNGKKDPNAYVKVIGLLNDRIRLSGMSFWYGANAKEAGPNMGELDGIAAVKNGRVKFDFDGCAGEVQLKGTTLVITGESGCGGMNVTFDGEYRRK